MIDDTVDDGFLDGRITITQPRRGYRAATDPVLLAASVPVGAGAAVLDLGCGVGTAALCLTARVGPLDLHGLEVQPDYAALARANADPNTIEFEVHDGDLREMPAALRQQVFDAVMLNPPWHPASGSGSPDPARDMANRLEIPLADWIGAALSRTRQGGHVVVIQRVERLPEILAALDGPAGDIAILPLAAREGRAAKRVIVRARKSARAPFRLAAPLVLHAGAAHDQDRDDFTARAAAILRGGAGLDF